MNFASLFAQYFKFSFYSMLLIVSTACNADHHSAQEQNGVQYESEKSTISLSQARKNETDFSQFWRSFKLDLINQDFAQLEKKTRFPLGVRGVSDGDPVKEYGKKDFSKVMKQVLAQTIINFDDQGNLNENSLLEELKASDTLSTLPSADQKYIQVKQFEFELKNGNWWLIQAYIE